MTTEEKGRGMGKSQRMRSGMQAATEWTVERVWALGYFIKLTLASRY